MSYLRYTIASIMLGVLVYFTVIKKKTRYTTISGIIKNAEPKKLKIGRYSLDNPLQEASVYAIHVTDNQTFTKTIPLDTATVLFLKYKHFSYPVFAKPGQKITVTINGSAYPQKVKITSKQSKQNARYNSYFQYYLYQNTKMKDAIDQAIHHLKKGDASEMLKVDNLRIIIAMEDFSGTPFNIFVYRAMSKYFYHSLQQLNNKPYLNSQQIAVQRDAILKKAENMGYFSNQSLASQPYQISRFINELYKTYEAQASAIKNMSGKKMLTKYKSESAQLSICKKAINDVSRYLPSHKSNVYVKIQLLAQHYNLLNKQSDGQRYTQLALQYLRNPVDDQLFQRIITTNNQPR